MEYVHKIWYVRDEIFSYNRLWKRNEENCIESDQFDFNILCEWLYIIQLRSHDTNNYEYLLSGTRRILKFQFNKSLQSP